MVGLGQCFLGYKYVRFVLAFVAFSIPALLSIGALVFENEALALVMFFLAIVLALLAWRLYLVFVFIVTFVVTMVIVSLASTGALLFVVEQFSEAFALALTFSVFAGTGLGIVAALLAVKIQRPAIILITSFVGGFQAGFALPMIFTSGFFSDLTFFGLRFELGGLSFDPSSPFSNLDFFELGSVSLDPSFVIGVIVGLALSIIGAFVQFATTANNDTKRTQQNAVESETSME